jgi:dTDP-4-dehydrorhamnose 3,5-epimerase
MDLTMRNNSTFDNIKLFDLNPFQDARGDLSELYKFSKFSDIPYWKNFEIKQINLVNSVKGTIRGFHKYSPPNEQDKVLLCIHGSIRDVLLDCNPISKTFGKTKQFELSADKPQLLLIPGGLAHAFQTLSSNSLIMYAFNFEYSPEFEININPLEGEFAENWINQRIVSEKDRSALSFQNFTKLVSPH